MHDPNNRASCNAMCMVGDMTVRLSIRSHYIVLLVQKEPGIMILLPPASASWVPCAPRAVSPGQLIGGPLARSAGQLIVALSHGSALALLWLGALIR